MNNILLALLTLVVFVGLIVLIILTVKNIKAVKQGKIRIFLPAGLSLGFIVVAIAELSADKALFAVIPVILAFLAMAGSFVGYKTVVDS